MGIKGCHKPSLKKCVNCVGHRYRYYVSYLVNGYWRRGSAICAGQFFAIWHADYCLKETHGSGGLLSTVRPLTLSDASALRKIAGVEKVVPVVQGSGAIEYRKLQRSGVILGVGPDMSDAWGFNVAIGRFFSGHVGHSRATAVLGYTMRKELFGDANPLGQTIRVGGQRFRIIGAVEKKGQMLGIDMDDVVYIPAQKGLQLFNRESVNGS